MKATSYFTIRIERKKLLIILSFVILSLLALIAFIPVVRAAAGPTTIASGLSINTASRYNFQTKVFYDSGTALWFDFYSDGTNMLCITSSDGVTWSSTTTIRASTDGKWFSIWWDSTNKIFYYAYAASAATFSYRYTTANPLTSAGCSSITSNWAITEQSPTAAHPNAERPVIATDDSSNIWISFVSHTTAPTDYHIEVWLCGSICAGPAKLDVDTGSISAYDAVIREMGVSSKAAVVYCLDGGGTCTLKYTTNSGTAWTNAFTTTTSYIAARMSAFSIGTTFYFAALDSTNNVYFWSYILAGSAPTETQIITGTFRALTLSSDGGNYFVILFADATDLYLTYSTNAGSTWTNQITLASNLATITIASPSANAFMGTSESVGVEWSTSSTVMWYSFNLVTEPIKITSSISNVGAVQSWAFSGSCAESRSSVPDNGKTYNVIMLNSCAETLTGPSTSNTRTVYCPSDCGSYSATYTFTSVASGTDSLQSFIDYYQVSNVLTIAPYSSITPTLTTTSFTKGPNIIISTQLFGVRNPNSIVYQPKDGSGSQTFSLWSDYGSKILYPQVTSGWEIYNYSASYPTQRTNLATYVRTLFNTSYPPGGVRPINLVGYANIGGCGNQKDAFDIIDGNYLLYHAWDKYYPTQAALMRDAVGYWSVTRGTQTDPSQPTKLFYQYNDRRELIWGNTSGVKALGGIYSGNNYNYSGSSVQGAHCSTTSPTPYWVTGELPTGSLAAYTNGMNKASMWALYYLATGNYSGAYSIYNTMRGYWADNYSASTPNTTYYGCFLSPSNYPPPSGNRAASSCNGRDITYFLMMQEAGNFPLDPVLRNQMETILWHFQGASNDIVAGWKYDGTVRGCCDPLSESSNEVNALALLAYDYRIWTTWWPSNSGNMLATTFGTGGNTLYLSYLPGVPSTGSQGGGTGCTDCTPPPQFPIYYGLAVLLVLGLILLVELATSRREYHP